MGNIIRRLRHKLPEVKSLEILPPVDVTTHIVQVKINDQLYEYSLLPLLTNVAFPAYDLKGNELDMYVHIYEDNVSDIYKMYYNNIVFNVDIVRNYMFEYNHVCKKKLLSYLSKSHRFIREKLPYNDVMTLILYQNGLWMEGRHTQPKRRRELKNENENLATFQIMHVDCSFVTSVEGRKSMTANMLEKLELVDNLDIEHFCSSHEEGVRQFKKLLNIIHRAPRTNCDIVVWRKDTFDNIVNARVGDRIHYPSFVSTTLMKPFAFTFNGTENCCLLKITFNPSVIHCIALMDSLNLQEYEIILLPCIMKVKKVYRRKGKTLFSTDQRILEQMYAVGKNTMTKWMNDYYKILDVTVEPGRLRWLDDSTVAI